MAKTETGVQAADRSAEPEESILESGGEMVGRLGAAFVVGVAAGSVVLWQGTKAFCRGVKRGVGSVRS